MTITGKLLQLHCPAELAQFMLNRGSKSSEQTVEDYLAH